jgi:penicillin-binding protein 1A
VKLEAKVELKSQVRRKKIQIQTKKILIFVSLFLLSFLAITTLALWYIYFYPDSIINFLQKIDEDKKITRTEILQKFYSIPEPTFFISKSENTVGMLFERYKEELKYDEIPQITIKAFIAAEDEDFFTHRGINPKAIVRAIITNIKEMRVVQGGSTITQQLAKNLFLTHERTLTRKLKELTYALQIEKELTKEEIISLYLSSIFFGNGAWGLKAAARNYFKKDIKDLTLAESALLAALPRSPIYYSPIKYPEKARARQIWVLKRMKELGFISEKEFEDAKNEKITVYSWDSGFSTYFWYLEHIRRDVLKIIGDENEIKRGYKIFTNLDEDCYKFAQKALRYGLERAEILNGKHPLKDPSKIVNTNQIESITLPDGKIKYKEEDKIFNAKILDSNLKAKVKDGEKEFEGFINPEFSQVLKPGDEIVVRKCPDEKFFCPIPEDVELEGAVVVISPSDGKVLCMIGGYNFQKSHFIRAVQAKRQVGSAIKPIVYTAAIETGLFSPATVVEDTPIVFEWVKSDSSGEEELETWRPKNIEGFSGYITLQEALAKSINAATVRVANKIGIQKIVDMFKRVGIELNGNYDLTIALGSISLSPIELARAYTPFANSGKLVEPYFISRIEKGKNIIFEYKASETEVIPEDLAFVVAWMMRNAVLHGTGWRAKSLKIPVAGKTGTTNDGKDAWFVGFTPEILAVIWVGKDDFTPIGRKVNSGPTVAVPIFVEFMRKYQEKLKGVGFDIPEGVEFAKINPITGEYSDENYYIMAIPKRDEQKDFIEEDKKDESNGGKEGEKKDFKGDIFDF